MAAAVPETPSRATISPLGLASAGGAALLIALATLTTADSDLWGHLRFGLDLLTTRRLGAEDPYSFTQDRPWTNHEWLSELQMGMAWALAGVPGLVILKGLLVTGALALAWGALAGVRPEARIVLFAALAAGTVPVTRTLRPQLWSLLSLAVLCRVLASERRELRRWLPLLFVFWANVHGGWIVGLGTVGLWLALEALTERTIRSDSVVVLLGCVLATLCTPYGWRLWEFLFATVSLSGRAITEWQPLWRSPPADSVPWVVGVLALAWFGRRPFPNRLQVVGVLAMLAYASLNVIRIVPLFVLCAGMLLVPAVARRWPARTDHAASPARGELPLAMGLLVAGVVGATWLSASSLGCIRTDSPRAADAAAVDLLKSAQSGRIVTFFDWGESAIWHLAPTLRVSMDGRRETVYSDARLDEHGAILEGTAAGFDVLAQWEPEYVWLPATSRSTRTWLQAQGYRIEHDTERSFVAVRPDLPVLQAPPSESQPSSACFPG